MQLRRAVPDLSTAATGRFSTSAMRLSWMPGLLAVLLAITIASWAFIGGDQPVFGDAQGCYDSRCPCTS